MKNRLRAGRVPAIRQLVAVVVTLLFLLPLFWIIVTALREVGAPPPTGVEWFPAEPQWGNFASAIDVVPNFGRFFLNSTLTVAIAVPLTLLTSSIAGFALSQIPQSDRNWIIPASVALLIVPAASVWIFRFQLLQSIGLLDTRWALIVPAIGASSPLYVLLYYWTFQRLPTGIVEAARLDGANPWVIWWRLAMPLARPTTAAVSILSFTLYWSDFVSPVLYIFRTELYTMPIWVQLLKQHGVTNWPLLMAGSVVMTAPVIIIFLLLQRGFLSQKSIAGLVDRN
ncbi:MAG: carbohydrate ABC transporter permease [Candidatus Promineifilaceae bacterium]